MRSTKIHLRRVVLTSALMSVSVFVLGCLWMVVLNDAQRGEVILLLGG